MWPRPLINLRESSKKICRGHTASQALCQWKRIKPQMMAKHRKSARMTKDSTFPQSRQENQLQPSIVSEAILRVSLFSSRLSKTKLLIKIFFGSRFLSWSSLTKNSISS